MGADRGIHVHWEERFPDGETVAGLLATAIEADGKPDLVLTGKLSVDTEGGQMPYRLAEALGMPVINEVVGLTLEEDTAVIRRDLGGAREVYRAALPCVVGAAKGLNEPRYPKLPDIMKAKKKEIRREEPDTSAEAPLCALTGLSAVPDRSGATMLEGDAKASVEALVRILRDEEKVI